MLREDEAPERGVDLDGGPRGDILEDDDPERDEEPEIESKQTNAQVWRSGKHGVDMQEYGNWGPPWQTGKRKGNLLFTSSLSAGPLSSTASCTAVQYLPISSMETLSQPPSALPKIANSLFSCHPNCSPEGHYVLFLQCKSQVSV